MDAQRIGEEFERLRPALTAYLTRLVVRADVAEELAQTVALRALEALERAPAEAHELRPWLFRIATNLGVDERRRHGAWRESLLQDAREAVESRPEFVETSQALRGSPEVVAIAREHLAVCFACTLGQLPPKQAAALLLKEVYDFTTAEVAGILDTRFAQVKNWLQAARAHMQARYAATCALIRKEGVCYQCVELDGFFGANQGNPLRGTDGGLGARLDILRVLRADSIGPWHRRLMRVFGEID